MRFWDNSLYIFRHSRVLQCLSNVFQLKSKFEQQYTMKCLKKIIMFYSTCNKVE